MANHYSTIGPAWLAFWQKHKLNGRDASLLPKVDVAIKVVEISDLDEHNGRYHTIFVCLLDWVDPSLERHVMNEQELDAHLIDFQQHFLPKIELLDYVSGELEYLSGDSNDPHSIWTPRIRPPKDGEFNHCTMTIKYGVTVRQRFNFRKFPFETQVLELNIQASPVFAGNGHTFTDGSTHGEVELQDPTRYRYKTGHSLAPACDYLPDWDLVELCSGTIPRKFDYDHCTYRLQIVVRRDASSIMWNQALSLFIIDVLSLVAYGIDPLDLADRSNIVFTMLLTGMAFKFVLSDKLPSVPYLTTFDRFMISTLFMLLFQGLLHWIVAEFEKAMCYYDGADWLTGALDSGFPNTTFVPSISGGYTNGKSHGTWKGREYPFNPTPDACAFIHTIDKCILFVHACACIGKYSYLIHLYHGHGNAVPTNGELRAFEQLDEFANDAMTRSFVMQKKMKLSHHQMAELLMAGKENRSNHNHKHKERSSFFFKDDENIAGTLAQKEQKKEELSTSDVGVEIEVVEIHHEERNR